MDTSIQASIEDVDVNVDSLADDRTDPSDPDTDGDGWWDGWIGVYDVGRSDDVVLYVEHLRDDDDGDGDTTDDGVQGEEIVQEQVGYHDVTAVASNSGTDIDGDGGAEHSNVHLGEQFWDTAPRDPSEEPSPSTTIDVGYYAGADGAVDTEAWRRAIEQNYRLYGIEVSVERDGELDDGDLTSWGGINACLDDTPPFSAQDLHNIDEENQGGADHYLFVGTVAGSGVPHGSAQTGVNGRVEESCVWGDSRDVTAVFTTPHTQALGLVPDSLGLTRDEEMRSTVAKTAVHEIGHILDLGEVDDRGGREIYSGRNQQNNVDYTPEFVANRESGNDVREWSVMSNGIQQDNYLHPTDGTYTAFSIEEFQTMDRTELEP